MESHVVRLEAGAQALEVHETRYKSRWLLCDEIDRRSAQRGERRVVSEVRIGTIEVVHTRPLRACNRLSRTADLTGRERTAELVRAIQDAMTRIDATGIRVAPKESFD